MIGLGRLVRARRRNPLVRLGARLCQRYLDFYENAHNLTDFARNGEAFVLAALQGEPVEHVLDVGANVGDWARLAATALPDAVVHCFEVFPETAARLATRVADLERVQVNAFGLGRCEGEVRLKVFDEYDVLTTTVDIPHPYALRHASGHLSTGDAYLAGRGLDRVGLVKIDVEGAEYEVLEGLSTALDGGAVEVIQFEYGTGSIVTKHLLYDYYQLLSRRGYAVGKLYPNYVEFRDYVFEHEDFRAGNFVAVHRSRADLVDRLGRGLTGR
ncbi:MAG: FkbM family methyltransferase [Ectothiorhodospiraceae bacterium]|nr:FkbM family methyltransferase [Ectothiorhodospiraceae bacterium]